MRAEAVGVSSANLIFLRCSPVLRHDCVGVHGLFGVDFGGIAMIVFQRLWHIMAVCTEQSIWVLIS